MAPIHRARAVTDPSQSRWRRPPSARAPFLDRLPLHSELLKHMDDVTQTGRA